jgi:hypothetical protein
MNIDDCYSEKKRNANGDIVARMSFYPPLVIFALTRVLVYQTRPASRLG